MSKSRRRKRDYLPATSAGLLSFSTEEAGGIKVGPWVPILLSVAVIVMEILLRVLL